MKKHFVTFLTYDFFFSEEKTFEFSSWDVDKALDMARNWLNSVYAFYFKTIEYEDGEHVGRETKRSGKYYLEGKLETFEELEMNNDPDDNTLIYNMRHNKWNEVIRNNKTGLCQPFFKGDIVIGDE